MRITVTKHSKHQDITIRLISEFSFSRLELRQVTVKQGRRLGVGMVGDDPPY